MMTDYRLTSASQSAAGFGEFATLTAQRRGDPAATSAVSVDDGRQFSSGADVPLSPVRERRQHRQQVEPGVGQGVLRAGPSARHLVVPGGQDAGCGQPAKSVGQHGSRGADRRLDLVEPA